jgi:predicted metal-dependent hydrolase
MKQYPFEVVINHKNVRNCRIRIAPDCRVHVTVPPGTDVGSLINLRTDWILRKIGELNRLVSEYETQDGTFIYNGKMWHPVFLESHSVSFRWPDICYPSVEKLRKAVSEKLREDISFRLDHYSKKMGVDYGRISIRNQKTRWGSCSGKGNLNFNIRAMALPETTRDYLVIHELVHRIEMNHSAAFWKKVSEYYPGYHDAEKELKAYWVVISRSRIWDALLDNQCR